MSTLNRSHNPLLQAASDLLDEFRTLLPADDSSVHWIFIPHEWWAVRKGGQPTGRIIGYDVPRSFNTWRFFGPEKVSPPLRAMQKSVTALVDLQPKVRVCLEILNEFDRRPWVLAADEGRFARVISEVLTSPWALANPWPFHDYALNATGGLPDSKLKPGAAGQNGSFAQLVSDQLTSLQSLPPVSPPKNQSSDAATRRPRKPLQKQSYGVFVVRPPLDRLEHLIAALQDTMQLTDRQKAILQVLDGVALRLDDVERKTGYNRGALYRRGGLNELVLHGLVKKDRLIGFYRPDRPPPGRPSRATP